MKRTWRTAFNFSVHKHTRCTSNPDTFYSHHPFRYLPTYLHHTPRHPPHTLQHPTSTATSIAHKLHHQGILCISIIGSTGVLNLTCLNSFKISHNAFWGKGPYTLRSVQRRGGHYTGPVLSDGQIPVKTTTTTASSPKLPGIWYQGFKELIACFLCVCYRDLNY